MSLAAKTDYLDFSVFDQNPDLHNQGHRVHMDTWKLYRRLGVVYYRLFTRMLSSRFQAPQARDQELVSTAYEQLYDLDNQQFVQKRDQRRDIFLVDGKPVFTDGWYIIKSYIELLSQSLQRLGNVGSVLEVGSGRGKNLALLALKHPEINFQGLELTQHGVESSRALVANLPDRYVQVAGYQQQSQPQSEAVKRVKFDQGSALAMPYEDKSFDVSFTCLVLEQLPSDYEQVVREMCRVTRKFCIFIEPFRDANNWFNRAYLRYIDYFRYDSANFASLGLEKLYFTTRMPQKPRYQTGLLIGRVK